jgi:hypothetical protein
VSAAEDEFWELWGEWGKDSEGIPKPLTVQPYTGTGQKGPTFGAPLSRPGLPQMPQRRLVRTSGGNEVLSTTAVAMPATMRGDFPLHSRVTLADGRVSTVLTVADGDTSGLFGFLVVNLE